jgi:hypothetical protein
MCRAHELVDLLREGAALAVELMDQGAAVAEIAEAIPAARPVTRAVRVEDDQRLAVLAVAGRCLQLGAARDDKLGADRRS